MQAIARRLLRAGAANLPALLLVRKIPLFEVEFGELEFDVDGELVTTDWAALELAQALGRISAADIDAYLGFGQAVSTVVLTRLRRMKLLEEGAPKPARKAAAPPAKASKEAVPKGGFFAFLRRLFGFGPRETGTTTPLPLAPQSPPPPPPAPARKVRESHAPATPICVLTAAGSNALATGRVTERTTRTGRLIFSAEPLLFFGVADETQQNFTQHRRTRQLRPDEAPRIFLQLNTPLGLPPEQRIKACGIDTGLRSFRGEPVRGYSGQLLGVVPGSPWEVRPVVKGRREQAADQEHAELILAAFDSSDASNLHWRAYVGLHNQIKDCAYLQVEPLLPPELRTVNGLLAAIKSNDSGSPVPPLRVIRGRLELVADQQTLLANLGESDRPDDTFFGAGVAQWEAGFRARMKPSDAQAARAAFFTILGRRDADLRHDFDATCSTVAEALRSYWQEDIPLPSPDEAAQHLWTQPALRAAVCMRRLKADLIEPYLPQPAHQRNVSAQEVQA
jgi:hypothetical protein